MRFRFHLYFLNCCLCILFARCWQIFWQIQKMVVLVRISHTNCFESFFSLFFLLVNKNWIDTHTHTQTYTSFYPVCLLFVRSFHWTGWILWNDDIVHITGVSVYPQNENIWKCIPFVRLCVCTFVDALLLYLVDVILLRDDSRPTFVCAQLVTQFRYCSFAFPVTSVWRHSRPSFIFMNCRENRGVWARNAILLFSYPSLHLIQC